MVVIAAYKKKPLNSKKNPHQTPQQPHTQYFTLTQLECNFFICQE